METRELKISKFIQELLPEATNLEQREAQHNFIRYINLVERIMLRIKAEEQNRP